MRYLLLTLLIPSIVSAQAVTIDPGCYISFQTYQCQEQENDFVWVDYGALENKAIYGAPVAALINQAVEDRDLLNQWIEYAERLEKRIKLWKHRARKGGAR